MDQQELTQNSTEETQPSEIDRMRMWENGMIIWAKAMINYMDIELRESENENLAENAIDRHDLETLKQIVSILEEKGA